ncbi:MAG: NAD(P)H-binding protein [Nitriliruptoraceae bacterium]
MAVVSVIGATGFTGRRIVTKLAARGHTVVAIGRDAERLAAACEGLVGVIERRVDLTEPGALPRALVGTSVAVAAVGPFTRYGSLMVAAALDAGVDLVDIAGEQSAVRAMIADYETAAVDAGVRLVPSAGFEFWLGDVLADLVAPIGDVDQIQVAYAVDASSGRGPTASRGTRRTVIDVVGREFIALANGRLVTQSIAETRRIAWFPRPVGPRHTIGIGGTECLSLPRRHPHLQTVETALAVPGWKAELLQACVPLVRRRRVRSALECWVDTRAREADDDRVAGARWSVVAEGRGRRSRARAWATGRDPYGCTADLVADVVERLEVGGGSPGVCSPAEVADPASMLDQLAGADRLRWGIVGDR